MAGGGGDSGGSVVQTLDPQAAIRAGLISAQGAQQAATQYRTGTTDAIRALNQQYSTALQGLRPAQMSGLSALNQLNQYLGLGAYNPGAAPSAPVAPTIENLAGKVSNDQIAQWIAQQSAPIAANMTTNANTQGNGMQVVNPNDPNQVWAYSKGSYGNYLDQTTPQEFLNVFGKTAGWQNTGANFNEAQLSAAGAPTLRDVASQEIAKNYMDLYQQQYGSEVTSYEQQKALYDEAKAQYDRYTAEGPLTQEQITAKVTAQPGFAAQQAQGINAIQSASSAKGLLGSGALLKNLMNFGQNLESQYYDKMLSNLSGMAAAGTSAAQNIAGLSQNQGGALANLYQSLGQNTGNAALSAANAQSQSLLNAGQQYQTMGGGGGNLSGIGSLIGAGAGAYFGGPVGVGIGSQIGSAAGSLF